jgi:superfamily II DNA or RNA helicase
MYAEWPLSPCRDTPQKEPAAHQEKALSALTAWYDKLSNNGRAGILVLPTGGGKTFTAIRFLTEGPLSDGYKVLWLAHTHHLLEQAFHSFDARTLGSIREPRRTLSLRVVSGTPGHFAPSKIEPTDDVVIATLQTITGAVREELDPVLAFIKAAKKKLFVVFDEAHHAPAPSYRKLVEGLKATAGAPVLGLTATPMYGDHAKQGWLKKLFPDGIIAQARATELMAAGVLARPHAVPLKTSFTPTFDNRDYQKWLGTFKDVPEYVVDELANNKERNAFIAKAYAENKKKYGKTIIFTDRWYQCEAIAEALARHGVKAGTVYSHVDAALPTVEQRKKRDRDENAKVLEQFRKNKLDVIINVRMLTEGTDIPEAQTVFLTRQTTSRILLTQMVGRALRGPKFGGTPDAYIVSFEDDWRQQIQWAGFELEDGGVGGGTDSPSKRPPLQLISIELIKKLARQMDGGVNVALTPFQAMLPLGWYRTMFDARVPGTDDVEPVDLLVMVYQDERDGFEALIKHLQGEVPDALADEAATLEQHAKRVAQWREKFLGGVGRSAIDLEVEILQIARHIAQRGSAPQFFEFEVRADHDLDPIAARHIAAGMGPKSVDDDLRREYARDDRFWRTLFNRYEQFRHAYDGAVARKLAGPAGPLPTPIQQKKAIRGGEPDEHVKDEVRARDKNECLACGTHKLLQVDHIVPDYRGGSGEPGNLQTLCMRCNNAKGTRTINFRLSRSPLKSAPVALPNVRLPSAEDAANPDAWSRFLRATLNFFFECAAVGEVAIAGRGDGYHNWVVKVRTENDLTWLRPHIGELLASIQRAREAGGKPRLESITFSAPGQRALVQKDDE